MSETRQPVYVCGHSASELERLEAQSVFFEDITRLLLEKAGITGGMRVLDIGCGAGDVSLLVADLVGPTGSVLGVDRVPQAVATAGARAAARGLENVQFRVSEIEDLAPSSPLDALVGRFVLMHQADPARTLHRAARHVRPGGVVALLESHLSASVAGVHSCPHSPTYDRILHWILQVIRSAGAHVDMGLRLQKTFADAGLPEPRLSLHARVEGGRDAPIYRYVIESVRSMLPLAERLGVAALSASSVEELERQLIDEVATGGGVITSPLVVAAWCRR